MARKLSLLLASLLIGCGVVVIATPARGAVPEEFYGHRCREYPVEVSRENTPAAMKAADRAGAGCEIDVWRLFYADETRVPNWCLVVYHDNLWHYKADPSTLFGIPDHVNQTTCEQVKGIRYMSGEPVAWWSTMMKAASRLDVHIIAEIKNSLPASILDRLYGERVWFYQSPSPGSCRFGTIDMLHSLGAKVGIKDKEECSLSRETVATHASFLADHLSNITPESVAAYKALGVKVIPMLVSKDGWIKAKAAGVTSFIVRHPNQAVNW